MHGSRTLSEGVGTSAKQSCRWSEGGGDPKRPIIINYRFLTSRLTQRVPWCRQMHSDKESDLQCNCARPAANSPIYSRGGKDQALVEPTNLAIRKSAWSRSHAKLEPAAFARVFSEAFVKLLRSCPIASAGTGLEYR